MHTSQQFSEISLRECGHDGSTVVESYMSEDAYSLAMPLSHGGVRCLRNGKKFFEGNLQPGMLRFGAPGEHYLDLLDPTPSTARFIEIIVPGSDLRRVFREAGFIWPTRSLSFKPLLKPNRVVLTLASASSMTSLQADDQKRVYIDGLTRSLLASLIDTEHFSAVLVRRPPVRPLSDEEFQQCCDYANSMIGHRLSLLQWSAFLNKGVGEFARAFRQKTTKSPYSWFLDKRIEHAKHLLLEQNLSIVEIALQTGFNSQSHFTEVFRRKVGCSPAKWKLSGRYSNRAGQ